jgi:hypothetical protein
MAAGVVNIRHGFLLLVLVAEIERRELEAELFQEVSDKSACASACSVQSEGESS